MKIEVRIFSAARYWLIHSRQIGLITMAVSFVALVCLLIQTADLTAQQSESHKATMSRKTSIRAQDRNNPLLSLNDGRELVTRYVGSESLRFAIEQNEASPHSLVSADFDKDGVPDIVCGYSTSNGGILALHRGNVDSIYPGSLEANRRKDEGTFTDAPFLAPGYLFGVPDAVDFLGAGDFDADGQMDVIAGAKYGRSLWLLSGDGGCGFSPIREIKLPGVATAVAIGEVNRRDGLEDIVVAITDSKGSRLLIFEGARGALKNSPEIIELPDQAVSLAIAELAGDHNGDIVAAAGNQLLIVEGRDRKLYLPARLCAEVKSANLSRRSFDSQILEMTTGDFSQDNAVDLALLTGNGTIRLLSKERVSEWNESQVESLTPTNQSSRLIAARISSTTTDNLILWEPESNQIRLSNAVTDNKKHTVDTLESDSRVVALMPMRLNQDALDDLVVLSSGSASPSFMTTRPHAIFSVTSTNDSGTGSLRQAIEEANRVPGADIITFGIAGRRAHTIRLLSALPTITEAVTIDATTQRGFNGNPVIELNDGSSSTQRADSGLKIEAANCVVKGLAINGFSQGAAIVIRTAAATDNRIEGCFIGTNVNGNSARANDVGVLLFNDAENPNTGARRNIIGGTAQAARNLISGNLSDGIRIGPENGDTSENIIQGNLIGTNVSGNAAIANAIGITILCPNNTVGGTAAGARNIVSGKTERDEGLGVLIFSDSNIVQGNLFGTNQAGDQAIQSINGVVVDAGRFNTIGGATADARNVMSGNTREGVVLLDASETLVQGNFIGTDISGTRAIGNSIAGIAITRSDETTLSGNLISGNNDPGIFVGFARDAGVIGQSNLFILDNIIGTDIKGEIDLGNLGDGIFVEVASTDNTIEGNIIAFNRGNGINIPNLTGNPGDPGVRISLLSNFVYSNDRLGINLGDEGITKNDDRDFDPGANELQNFPVLNASRVSALASARSGTLRPAVAASVEGTFNSTPSSTFTLQFYFGVNCPTGGTQFVGFIPVLIKTMSVNTDGNGNASYNFTFEMPAGQGGGFVNGIATDSQNNTSELSECIAVGVTQVFPAITELTKAGKKLFVAGENFDSQAKIMINGQEQQTKFQSSSELLGKKAGKKLKPGDRVQVRNSDGKFSNLITF